MRPTTTSAKRCRAPRGTGRPAAEGGALGERAWPLAYREVIVLASGATDTMPAALESLRCSGLWVRVYSYDDPAMPARLVRERPRLVLLTLRGEDEPSITAATRLLEPLRSMSAAMIGVIDGDDPPGALLAELTDFVRPPYTIDDLALRVQVAEVRGRIRQEPSEFEVGGLHLDVDRFRAGYGDRVLALSYKEFELLRLFMQLPDRVVSREVLLAHIWPGARGLDPRIVDTHVNRLRRKMREAGASHLVTIRKRGFLLRSSPCAITNVPD